MFQVLSADLWPIVGKHAGKAAQKHAAVAYVTSDKYVNFGHGDVLVADASDEAVRSGQTSAAVLRAAHDQGAKLYSLPGLHAKVICLDRVVVLGSANLSVSSHESLVEAAIMTDHPGLLSQARALIAELRDTGDAVDEDFLKRIEAIDVVRVPRAEGARRGARRSNRTSRTWLVGIHLLDDDAFPAETVAAEAGQRTAEEGVTHDDSSASWIRFTGTSRFRGEAVPGDTVIRIERRTSKSKRAKVYFPSPIIHRQEEPTCTRLYVEEFAGEDERAIPWGDFTRMWGQVSSAALPSLNTTRLLTETLADQLLACWPAK